VIDSEQPADVDSVERSFHLLQRRSFQAPDFALPGHRGGETFRLSDLRGKKNVVIVFYPLDWTPV
jgi:peroxiredoxin